MDDMLSRMDPSKLQREFAEHIRTGASMPAPTEERGPVMDAEHSPEPVERILDPDYARIYTQARIIAWQYGWACLAHGSRSRDLDLLLVPWTDRSSDILDHLVARIADVCGLTIQGNPSPKPHGRKAWTLMLPGFSEVRWVDLSALPIATDTTARGDLASQLVVAEAKVERRNTLLATIVRNLISPTE